jgi:hypothetical protein
MRMCGGNCKHRIASTFIGFADSINAESTPPTTNFLKHNPFQKLTTAQLVKFVAFYGNRKFINYCLTM